MSFLCLLKHDWQTLNSASALELSCNYINELYKDSDVLPEYTNFIGCPDHIVFEDKVCLRCRDKQMNYTRVKNILPKLYEKYRINMKINRKRVEERRVEINRRENERIEKALEILKEDSTE